MRAVLRPFLFLLVLLLLAPAVSADWLVTKEGARIETKGPWKVKGAVVVFTMPNGTLSSMRVRELDLDQSALVTAEANKPPEEEGEAGEEDDPKPVVAEFTNENIRRAAPSASEGSPEQDGEDGERTEELSRPVVTPPYEVLAWNVVDRPEIDGIEVRGTLRNGGEETIANVSIVLRLLTPDNAFVDERRGNLQSTLLRAQAATNFSAAFPNLANEPYKLEVDVASR
jgi:hypothetical protein